MSNHEMLDLVTFESGANLNGQLYRALAMNTDGEVILATTNTDYVVGILAHDPQRSQFDTDSTEGDVVSVGLLRGFVPMVAGGVITAGDFVHAGAAGAVVSGGATLAALAAGDFALGRAMEAGVAGQVIRVFAQPVLSAA